MTYTTEEKEIAIADYRRTAGIQHNESQTGAEGKHGVSKLLVALIIIVVVVTIGAFVQFAIQLPV